MSNGQKVITKANNTEPSARETAPEGTYTGKDATATQRVPASAAAPAEIETEEELGRARCTCRVIGTREPLQRSHRGHGLTDNQIDRLVYELYGLTDDEIRLIEETTACS